MAFKDEKQNIKSLPHTFSLYFDSIALQLHSICSRKEVKMENKAHQEP
jgi:hypothetical protein